MSLHIRVSLLFLGPVFHGRTDGGAPEWPPSPLRVFEALVAAAAARWGGDALAPHAESALRWLEQQPLPMLIAPAGVAGAGYRLSVPNNAMDIVARAWSRGNDSDTGDASPATHRTMKAVRPTWLRGGDSVSYLWPLTEPLHQEVIEHVETLGDMARHVVALGWGIDLVVGHCAVISQAEIAELPGERWLPVDVATTGGLRVPIPGTLDDLTRRHRAALNRLRRNTLTPLPQLSAYGTTAYRRATDPQPREVAALSLLKLDGSGFRPFDTVRRSLTVAGMTRHAAKRAAASAGWAAERINAFVLGHGDSEQEAQHVPVGGSRLAFLPLPTIEGRGEAKARVAGSIRRVCLTAFGDTCRQEIAWARRALSGMELLDEQTGAAVALLATPPANDRTLRQYVGAATTWTTVTPVVLPGYDDPKHYRRRLKQGVEAEEQKKLLARLDDRTDALLRKAIVQAGHPQALAAHAELEWRKVGFLRGVDLASRYGVPAHLESFPRLHVRIRWRDELGNPVQVPGPICLGGGRFYGLGLFVSVRDEA